MGRDREGPEMTQGLSTLEKTSLVPLLTRANKKRVNSGSNFE
jgi:hypothetical protein